MPEGHTIHRLARDHREMFGGQQVTVTSPQGRFGDASVLDSAILEDTEAWGKHLFYRFEADRWIHIHLGLFGRFISSPAPCSPPGPSVRLRLNNSDWVTDLIGATQCELMDSAGREKTLMRLGPDPLRSESQPERAWERITKSRRPLAALLMNQQVLAGVGNVYRAELLFRARLNPYLEGRALTHDQWQSLWGDASKLMRAGERANRIVTTQPEHRERPRGRARKADATYAYGRHGLPCRICGTVIQRAEVNKRRLYWCPTCQT